jgi:hypothetical protein
VAGKGKAVGAAIKYGPLVYAAAQKYGPNVWEQLRAQREPAERFVQDRVTKGNQRKKALQHARTVVGGSVLQVFHHNRAHWIVFSGDEAIAVHPPTGAPYDVLLKHADLSTRVEPGRGATFPKIPRAGRAAATNRSGARRSPGQRPAQSSVRYHDAPAQTPTAVPDNDKVQPGTRTADQPPTGTNAADQRPTA